MCRAIPTTDLTPAEVAAMTVVDLLVRVGAAESKGEARKLLAGGGITLNGKRLVGGTGFGPLCPGTTSRP